MQLSAPSALNMLLVCDAFTVLVNEVQRCMISLFRIFHLVFSTIPGSLTMILKCLQLPP